MGGWTHEQDTGTEMGKYISDDRETVAGNIPDDRETVVQRANSLG
jgi:hypothetical protein